MNNFWRLRFGRICEQKAMQFLKLNGYWIEKKNFRTKLGEIDLIAKKNDLLVFVEVKAIVSKDDFSAIDHFDHRKRRKQLLLAKQYLLNLKEESFIRFDLITVTKKDADYFIEHFENVIDESS